MRIEKLKNEMLVEFINYCKKYGPEHDDSFLFDEELDNFEPNEDNPTYVILNERSNIIGAVSLMINPYYKRGRKGRFRILHSIEPKRESYYFMLKAVHPHLDDIDRVYLFIPEEKEKVQGILKSIGFTIERYSYVMTREDIDIPEYTFPDGFELRTFQFGRDEEDWCSVRNEGFANLAGCETPMTPEMVSKMEYWDDNLDGGMMILYHNEKPVGVIRISRDSYEDLEYACIGPIALKHSYQGMGFGRNLIRAGLQFGKCKGLPISLLTVNAENDNALKLYLQEGFKKKQVVVCYNYDIKR